MINDLLLSLQNNWNDAVFLVVIGLLLAGIVTYDIITIERALNTGAKDGETH